ncbi:MAG: transglutaminase-like domain-containing protein [Dysgonamonadaceae bacterium]|jgi:transglutaminase-like putative cysteine protease|nr:transglutaminase-like domain-containing protein [Dysgonamonadaceae bacterium]
MKTLVRIFLFFILLTGCTQREKHFLNDKTYRDQVHEQFLHRQSLLTNREAAMLSVFDDNTLTVEQQEALEFLYAYMPLCDLADYDGKFFLDQVNAALKARDYFSWGKTIPEDIFRHFVLVYRVNNENLDTARMVFFDELKDRISGMSMEEAVLEVNHWCHEKVTYRGTDGRTSAPLALVRTGWGRCGEESTFTATALRAVGIPARQCYTPRWAHTDDNHAWVEAWVDGKWHYIGACEPEPELDVAWFTAPAKRAMMVHTNVFGLYRGPEEKNLETNLYSKINLLANYAPTRQLKVNVRDTAGRPVVGADVRFKLYNYAQIYPIAESKTDSLGNTSLLTGLGDLVVWANKGAYYGYLKAPSGQNEIVVELKYQPGETYDEKMELVPPVEQKIKPVDESKIVENAGRFAYEDSVRNAYMATFINQEQANVLAKENGLDQELVWKYLHSSQGNWKEISNFMKTNRTNPYLFEFLASLSEKDLRDTPEAYLNDHLNEGTVTEITSQYSKDKNFVSKYILSPRIGIELIKPWRSFLNAKFQFSKKEVTPAGIIDWMKKNIRIMDAENYYNCAITPIGVAELRISDSRSRDIAFVAACRTYNIPARLEPSTSKPQYFEKNRWVDALFEAPSPEVVVQAQVTFVNSPANTIKPQYEIQYTIAKFADGDFVPLDYYGDPALKTYPATISVDTGYYRLMTGSRANDGSVTTFTDYFVLKANEKKVLDIEMPEVDGKLKVMGIVDMNTIVQLKDGNKNTLKDLSNGKGLVLCFIDPDKEPSKHILQDFPALQQEFDAWNGGIVFMTPDDKLSVAFDASAFKGLPKQTVWTVDSGRTLLKSVSNTLQLNFQDNFPLTLYLSKNGGVLFFSEGYRIGTGENIIKTVRLEEALE